MLADSDGDGLPDEWETAHGLNPSDPSDAVLDNDGDGASNAEEYLAGTDPNTPADYLRLESIPGNDTNCWNIRFLAVSNRTYTVVARSELRLGDAWRSVADVLAAPTNRTVQISQPFGVTNQQFFRMLTPMSRE